MDCRRAREKRGASTARPTRENIEALVPEPYEYIRTRRPSSAAPVVSTSCGQVWVGEGAGGRG